LSKIPLVDYLELGTEPHLVANECTHCGARFFDRRSACAHCFGTEFKKVQVASTGTLRSFSVVNVSAPGVKVPFIAGVIDLADGTAVRGNIVGVEPDVANVRLGMELHLVDVSFGVDNAGNEAIGYGFEPTGASNV